MSLHRYVSACLACLLLGTVLHVKPAAAGQAIPILVYHRFDPAKSALTTIPVPVFEQQLDWLNAHHYHVVPLRAVTAWLVGTGPTPASPAVVITVDDGHISDFTQLYPIILRRHLPVTLFIYPSAISNASYALTWVQLMQMQ